MVTPDTISAHQASQLYEGWENEFQAARIIPTEDKGNTRRYQSPNGPVGEFSGTSTEGTASVAGAQVGYVVISNGENSSLTMYRSGVDKPVSVGADALLTAQKFSSTKLRRVLRTQE